MKVTVALAALALAFALGASGALAAPGPVDPEEIAQAERIDQGRPYVSPTGEQIVAWKVQGGPLRPLAARVRGGGGFGAVEELSLSSNTGLPEIAFNAAGAAYAVWPVRTVGAFAESAIRPPGGSFGAVQDAGSCHASISLAVSAQGKLAIGCATYRSSAPNYQAAFGVADELRRLAPANYFLAPVDDPYLDTTAAWGADGTLAVAVRQEPSSTAQEIRVLTRDPAGTGTPAALVASESDPRWLELGGLAVFPDGTVALGVNAGGATTSDPPILRLRRPGAPTVPLSLPGQWVGSLQMDGSGRLHMLSSTSSMAGASYASVSANAAGELMAPVAIPAPAAGAYLSDFLVAADGSEVATFFDSGSGSIYVSRRPAGAGAFEPPIQIAASGARSPQAALTPTGDVLIVWTRAAGPDDDRVVVGGLDSGAGPTLSATDIPARVLANAPVRFSASATDTMGIRSIAWTFGDGGSAAGGEVSHTFTAAGPHAVRVTATDRAGNSTAHTATVQVIGTPAPDRRRARLRVKGKKRIKFKALKRRGARYRVRANEPVNLVVQLIARPRSARISAAGDLILAERRLKLNRKARAAKLKPRARLLGRLPRKLRLRVRLTATDTAGNQTVVTRRLRVRR